MFKKKLFPVATPSIQEAFKEREMELYTDNKFLSLCVCLLFISFSGYKMIPRLSHDCRRGMGCGNGRGVLVEVLFQSVSCIRSLICLGRSSGRFAFGHVDRFLLFIHFPFFLAYRVNWRHRRRDKCPKRVRPRKWRR